MYQVYETKSGKIRYAGSSFERASKVKDMLSSHGIKSAWVFKP